MLKGCKHYFTMFGMMVCAINTYLLKFFTQIDAQQRKSIPIIVKLNHIQLQNNIEKNQTYQG